VHLLIVQISLLFNGQQGWNISSGISPFWLEDCVNFTPMPEENDQYRANHYNQQANPAVSIHNYSSFD
jgi:hypothetical protein